MDMFMTVNTIIEGTVDSASRSPQTEEGTSGGSLSFNSLLNGVSLQLPLEVRGIKGVTTAECLASLGRPGHEEGVRGSDDSSAGANAVLLTGVGLIPFMGFSGIPLDLTGDMVCLPFGGVKEHLQGAIKNGAALLVSESSQGVDVKTAGQKLGQQMGSPESRRLSGVENSRADVRATEQLFCATERPCDGATITPPLIPPLKVRGGKGELLQTAALPHCRTNDGAASEVNKGEFPELSLQAFKTLRGEFLKNEASLAQSANLSPINPDGAGIKPQSQGYLSVSSGSLQLTSKDNDKPSEPNASNITVENISLHVNGRNGADGPPEVQPPKGHIAVDTVFDDTLMKTGVDDTSLRVSAEHPGIGKLDIELVLHKGLINGQINVFDAAGKEAIERNLYGIVNMLVRDGLSIGGLSVFLRDGRGQGYGGMDEGTSGLHRETHLDATSSSIINIYV